LRRGKVSRNSVGGRQIQSNATLPAAPEEVSSPVVKKQKPTKDAVASKKAAAPAEEKPAPKKSALKKEKQSPKPKAKKAEKVEEPVEQQDEDVPSEVEQEEEDDETKALVKTLDSGDEDEAEVQISTFKEGQDVGKIPKAKKATKSSAPTGTPGVMYLARLPHGFYEHELRDYFKQFGDITRLRVVRSKKTGASRHRAFIEFADAEVADIAARTMDKYLLFGHILTAKTVPPSQVHPNLFKGANRRFKAVPWNKMAGRQLERPLSEGQWQVKISKEEQRRAARAEKLKEMDYEFEAPALKAAEAKPLLENGTEEEPKAIEAAPAVAEETETKEEEEVAEPEAPKAKATKSEKATPQKKGKKGKKTKS
jgi:nucleolar protein 15